MGHEVLISKPITHDQLVYIANWMTHYDESFKKLSKEIDSIKNDHVAFIEKKVDVSIKEIKITQSEINCIRKEIEEFKDLLDRIRREKENLIRMLKTIHETVSPFWS